jgi:hypothetical protein
MPPTTRAGTISSARVMGRSLMTQMSRGSPSPRSAPGQSAAICSPQYVRGMKPYSAGGCDEVRCGRSTRR